MLLSLFTSVLSFRTLKSACARLNICKLRVGSGCAKDRLCKGIRILQHEYLIKSNLVLFTVQCLPSCVKV